MTSTMFAGAGALILILSILAGTAVSLFEAKGREIGSGAILRFVMISVPLSTLTARLLYAVITASPIDLRSGFQTGWSGQTLLYGAAFGYAAAAVLISKLDRIPFLRLLDILAPGTALCIALGRMASFFNGSCFGQAVVSDTLKFFPFSIYVHSIRSWLYAVFTYEALYTLLVFFLLLLIRNKMKRPGDLFAWFVLLYCCGRVITESIRADNLYVWFANISQVISILLVLSVLISFSVRALRSRGFRVGDILGWLGTLLCVAIAFFAEFFMGAETAVRNLLAMTGAILLLLLIATLYYRSIRQKELFLKKRFLNQ